jgi:MFS family permease
MQPLRRNRDFNLLWSGRALSMLGARASTVAFPLLVLATTGSPARAGLVAFAADLPLPLLVLVAGVVADRVDRRRAMLAADAVRFVALGSLVVALFAGTASYLHVLVVAFVGGAGFVVFWVCESAALRHVVPDRQLATAVSLDQARQYGANLAGPPLGGALFGAARALPFLAGCHSYVASFATVFFVPTPLQGPRREHANPFREAGSGFAWLWRRRFLRTATLLGAVSNFVLTAAFVPLLALTDDVWLLGAVLAVTFALYPVWNAAFLPVQIASTPDPLRGRVASVIFLLGNAAAPLAGVAAGFLLEAVGARATILGFSGLLVLAALAAVRYVRGCAAS